MFSFFKTYFTYPLRHVVMFSCISHTQRRCKNVEEMVRPSGTQTLDKCWDCCKDLVPNQISTADPKTILLNGDLWNCIYQSHWRYNNRHNLWQMVPQVMRHTGNQRRYLVLLSKHGLNFHVFLDQYFLST